MRSLTRGAATLDVEGTSVFGIIENIETKFPGLKARLLDEVGKRRKFVNFYVNGEDIRHVPLDAATLKDGDELEILPMVAGG